MEENNTQDEAMKVLLTPEAYIKWKQGQLQGQTEHHQSHIELTDEEKAEVDKQMADPLRTSDSKLAHWVQDLWNHPEKCKWYRDHVLYPTTEEKFFPERIDNARPEWTVEIPIFSMDF